MPSHAQGKIPTRVQLYAYDPDDGYAQCSFSLKGFLLIFREERASGTVGSASPEVVAGIQRWLAAGAMGNRMYAA